MMHSQEAIRILKKRKFDDYKYSPPDDAMEIDTSLLNFKPTKYEMEVSEVAKKRNTIAHSDIGAENSLIAVMLIKEIAKSVKLSGRKRLIIFLAPTAGLVHQAVEIFSEKSPDINKDCEFFTKSSHQLKYYLEELLRLVKEHLPQAIRKDFRDLLVKWKELHQKSEDCDTSSRVSRIVVNQARNLLKRESCAST